MVRGCPNEEELPELASLPEEALPAAVRAHLDGCPACRARLDAARRDSALFSELQGLVRHPVGPPVLPGYRIEEELRRGGQGIVYRALQEGTSRRVAVKVLTERGALSARERRRFEREVELGSRLSHPGIVTVFDSGLLPDGSPWYAMELVDGETLDEHVARRAPPLEARLALFVELCAAVSHAHRSGVIHRDLKPGNVLVDRAGRVRVLDFGTALPLAAGRLTAPGEFLGTLAYAAPEQVEGAPEACDTRADVYALGVVLYELVTGALPVDVEGPLSVVVERILKAAPEPPERRVAGLDRDLARILTTALAKDREQRYSSVEALARDVGHFLAHEPIEARSHSPGYVLAKALRRHRRGVAATLALVLVGAFLLGALLRARLSARRADENAVLVRNVIQDILGAAAPGRMGGDAPLRDVLALAAREIESTLEDAPDAQAAVQLTIGDTYRRLLMYREAEGHLRLALERYATLPGTELERARCLELLGAVLAAETSPEAIPVQEEALAIRTRRLPAGDPRIALAQRALGLALLAQVRDADFARARTLLESARAGLRASPGADPVEVAETELGLARLAGMQGDDADEGFRRALTVLEREAPEDPRLIECLTEYSAYLQGRRRFEEADDLLARAEERTRALYGDELTSDLLRRRARIAAARGELAGSEELSRRALAFELRRWASGRPDEASQLEHLAAALAGAGDAAFVPAFRQLRRFRGDGAFELASWMNALAEVLAAEGRPRTSEALLEEALFIRCRAFGDVCPVRQRTLLALGELLAREGRTDEARPRLAESLAIAESHGFQDEIERVRGALACCADEGGLPTRAERP